MIRITLQDFIKRSNLKHNNKYDYSLVDGDITTRKKIKVICPVHGEFEQTPEKHLLNRGCPYCGGTKKLSTDEFIVRANKKHNFYYDYSLVNYVNSKIPVKIVCPIHGEFEQRPDSHLNGNGCKFCGLNKNDFIKNANNVYHNKYDYSLTDYKNTYTKVKIICQLFILVVKIS